MSKAFAIGVVAVLLTAVAVAWRVNDSTTAVETTVEAKAAPPSAAPMCPWREPDADLQLFFPGADHCEVDTRILSGLRLELTSRLGRAPNGAENALRFHRVWLGTNELGTVLTRRVKGTHGAIEIVLATDAVCRMRGVRLQRLREPEPVAAALQNPDWLRAFAGKQAEDAWKLGTDIPEVFPEARESAAAVVEGVRSELILLSIATQSGLAMPVTASQH